MNRVNHGSPRPSLRGEQNSQSVLTWDAVRSIRHDRACDGITYQKLADTYGVSLSTIKLVIWNRAWVDPAYTPPPRRTYTR